MADGEGSSRSRTGEKNIPDELSASSPASMKIIDAGEEAESSSGMFFSPVYRGNKQIRGVGHQI
ncbi:hypothetical protein E2562_033123 [Oryza meyeriana var. granulata]|uniref:Uncharacterized protein n=1 Tax=Oryza meyeriana var. granulata TaxID=110450 RepID=A0A6G1CKB4_9ORYZ|nr:hypothetical protein E2562_033123 [Oryza meyeriana var. granulata]